MVHGSALQRCRVEGFKMRVLGFMVWHVGFVVWCFWSTEGVKSDDGGLGGLRISSLGFREGIQRHWEGL